MNDNTKTILSVIILVFVLYYVSKIFKGVGKGITTITETAGTVTDNFGITSSDEAKELKTMKCFTSQYWHDKGANTKILTVANAQKLAKDIYDAKTGAVYNDDDATYAVFKQMQAKSQISFLTEIFYKVYKKDLLTYFYSLMQDRYLRQLSAFIKALPDK